MANGDWLVGRANNPAFARTAEKADDGTGHLAGGLVGDRRRAALAISFDGLPLPFHPNVTSGRLDESVRKAVVVVDDLKVPGPLISARSRSRFSEFASAFGTLHEIDAVFESEGFAPDLNLDTSRISGQRRELVAQYHSAVDMTDPREARRLLNVYLDALERWTRPEARTEFQTVRSLILSLRRDGFAVGDDGVVAEIPAHDLSGALDRYALLGDPEVLQEHLRRIRESATADPAACIGSAKELVESTCRLILDECRVSYSPDAGLLELYKKVAGELRLSRDAVPESAKGSEAAKVILQNLASAVQRLAELRNELGIGHGRSKVSPALQRHGRLAANAAATVTEFLLDTWHARRERGGAPVSEPR